MNTDSNCNISTPIQPRSDISINGQYSHELWTPSTSTSTGSILRSSSRYTASKLSTTGSRRQKRVRIVSPIKWDIHNNSPYSLSRRRQFINTTLSFCNVKQILRSLDCDTRGGYEECVETLLQSGWIPDRRYIEYNERLRARPIQACHDRVVKLQNGGIEYLSTFSCNELKKWLKYNNISQPSGANKEEYIKIIHQHFQWRSPSPDSITLKSFRIRPSRPCFGSKSKSRTPRHCSKVRLISNASLLSPEDIEMCDHETSDHMNQIEQDQDDEIMVRMQLCFDD